MIELSRHGRKAQGLDYRMMVMIDADVDHVRRHGARVSCLNDTDTLCSASPQTPCAVRDTRPQSHVVKRSGVRVSEWQY
jgi:hypothetical protein